MTTNDKKPPKTPRAAKSVKTPKSSSGAADSLAAARHSEAAGGATHAPSPPTKMPRSAKSGSEGAMPAGIPLGASPAIKAINVSVTPRYREDRQASIAKAAYFRSESRGFEPGHEVEDWLAAEEEVDQRLLGEGRAS